MSSAPHLRPCSTRSRRAGLVALAAVRGRSLAACGSASKAGHPIEFTLICKTKEEPATARDRANQAVEKKVDVVVVTSTGQGFPAVLTCNGNAPDQLQPRRPA